jgi:hypothetical protein
MKPRLQELQLLFQKWVVIVLSLRMKLMGYFSGRLMALRQVMIPLIQLKKIAQVQ